MEKIDISHKLNKITEFWKPGIIGELNGQHVKLAKLKGNFVWHQHDEEDELFYVLSGVLKIEFRDRTEILKANEMLIVPKKTEHRPIADKEVHVLLFEPAGTLNTGNQNTELSRYELDWL
jgi:mannose-6-phosphate isomerase-like protein (cupin superfamily)